MMPEQMLEEVFKWWQRRGLGSRAPRVVAGTRRTRVFRRDAPAAPDGDASAPETCAQPFRKQSFQKRLRREFFPYYSK